MSTWQLLAYFRSVFHPQLRCCDHQRKARVMRPVAATTTSLHVVDKTPTGYV